MEIAYERGSWNDNLALIGIIGDVKTHLFDPPNATVLSQDSYKYIPAKPDVPTPVKKHVGSLPTQAKISSAQKITPSKITEASPIKQNSIDQS